MTNTDKDLAKFVIILGASYFLVIRPIFQKLGLQKTEQEKIIKEKIELVDNSNAKDNPFSGRIFLAGYPKGTILLTQKSVNGIVKALRNSFTIFGDNESKVIGIFRQLKTKAQVAQISDVFYKYYTMDMWNFLKNGTPYGGFLTTGFAGLNDNELIQIVNIVNKLPKYK